MDDNLRKERMLELFENHIVPFTNKTLSKSGIRELAEKGEILLLLQSKKS